ncbi:TonB-dependent receptor [Brevundimonas aveniformis]|uniref:TonB-dependent receptor n=1 Tax=Brevundimonas aveniformis TaxID=370977 RepID=UPI00040A72A3|nr:TonB-dependent receptor [Brevundimonas aveniformis]
MNRIARAALLASAAWSAMSVSALAQETQPTGNEDVVGEVIVTARRREEALQDVPIAVTSLSSERLEQTGATDITALQQQTPNATVQVARGSNSTLISFIRGVGQQDPLWGFEPGVGLYVDDVYIARPQGAVLDIFDINRIEVLRGPQGTLYGRNTIGGAIKYVTDRIGQTPEFEASATLGSYRQADVIVSGGAPVSETLSFGAAFARYTRDGFGENLTTGEEQYNRDVTGWRLSAEWTPTDALFFRLAYDRVEDNSNPRHGHREVNSTVGGYTPPASVYDTEAGLTGEQRVVTEGLSLTGEWYVNDWLTLRSITANRRGDTATVIDFDQTPLPYLDVPAIYSDNQFSQEFQALFEGDRWSGVAGIYYLDSTAAGVFDTIAGNLGVVIAAAGSVDTTSWSVFGDFSYELTDRLEVSVGGRWTQDDKTGDVYRAFFLGATRSPLTGGTVRPVFATRTDYTASETFERFTPRVSLTYDFTDALTGYASYSQGFKSGGWDMRGDAFLTPQTVNGYDPEIVDTFEVGLKGNIGRRFLFSSAVFYSAYEDQQITSQVVATLPATGIASIVDNVGSSTIYGAEFEATAFLTDNLTAFLSYGYLHAEFDEFITYVTGSPVDISNIRVFQNSPEHTVFLGATWTQPDVFGGELSVTPSISYRSDYHLFEAADPILDQDGYALVDLAASWDAPGGNWSLGFNGRNLTDETYRVGGYNFAGATFNNSISAFYGPPRTFSFTLTARY